MRILNIICSGILIISLAVLGTYNYKRYISYDEDGPEIVIESDEIAVSIHDDQSVLLQGVTAFDTQDGDVTDSIGIVSISGFIDDDYTTRQVNYVAFDDDSHVASASRKMVYTDYQTIHFSLDAPLRFPMQSSNINILKLLHAKDCIDGDISNTIIFSDNSLIQADIASEYDVVIQASNSVGEIKELPVTIRIYDSEKEIGLPQIVLSDYLVYTKVGEKIDPKKFIRSVRLGGVEYLVTEGEGTFAVDTYDMSREEKKAFVKKKPEVNIDLFNYEDNIDYNTPGVYEIKYSIETFNGDRGTVYQIVVVE